jgi:molecular chaperone GrpE
MTSDKRDKGSHRIPIRFNDADDEVESSGIDPDEGEEINLDSEDLFEGTEVDPEDATGGPDTAELIAAKSELKRIEAENAELKDRLQRRQADFENYRKRVERERTETYNRVVSDVAAKLLPVVDNLKRALDAEASVEASESDEFRHFLSGVDLISKQLNGVLDALGVKPIAAVGEKFDPHIHEAVVTEATDDYEPDTVMQEIVSGYRLGDKLIRPALVKVATRK